MNGHKWAFWLYASSTILMLVLITGNPNYPLWLRAFIAVTMPFVTGSYFLKAYHPLWWGRLKNRQ